jgi:3-dehydroquinate synthase
VSGAPLVVGLGSRSYPLHIGPGLLAHAELFADHLRGHRAIVVTNETIAPLYAARLEATLSGPGIALERIVIPDGEAHKSWQTLDHVFESLLKLGADRHSVLIALGGGVVGDITGFAAATYQRGIDYLQVPTTLLAQVDSSVGGKTAINHALGKNMVGAFHQPRAVIADTDTLATLPPREFAAGLAEVVKYGAICDLEFFGWLEANMEKLHARDAGALAHAIRRSCEIKAQVVEEDELESGVRAILNFGHTFAHAIESAAGYGAWLHGEAVGAGMVLAARLSARLGRIAPADAERLTLLVQRARLPTRPPPIPVERWLELMGRDKKNEGGRMTLILLDALGRAAIEKGVERARVEAFLAVS